MKIQIKCKSLMTTSLISYQSGMQINRLKRSGKNLDELNECS